MSVVAERLLLKSVTLRLNCCKTKVLVITLLHCTSRILQSHNSISTYRIMQCMSLRRKKQLNNQRAIEPDAERYPALAIHKKEREVDAYG